MDQASHATAHTVVRHGDQAAFWTQSNDEILRKLSAKAEGLSLAEASERLRRYGPNRAVAGLPRTLAAKLAKRIAEPLIAILLIAAGISGATGDWQSFIIIVIIVLFSIGLDILQEQKAESAVEALKRSVAVTASVRRGERSSNSRSRNSYPATWSNCRQANSCPQMASSCQVVACSPTKRF